VEWLKVKTPSSNPSTAKKERLQALRSSMIPFLLRARDRQVSELPVEMSQLSNVLRYVLC
jgi:hypothetical protein